MFNVFISSLSLAWLIVVLMILFFILGFSADKVISNVRALALKLGLPVFILGLFLGILTSFPEMAVGINAVINDIPNLSAGNLFGGVIVMLSLILGTSVLLNKGIDNDGKNNFLFLALAYIILPVTLALKGSLNFFDGLVLVILYLLLIWRLYKDKHQGLNFRLALLRENKVFKELFIIIIGVVIIILSANFIVDITSNLLTRYNLSPYIIGLIFFPIGTNLPEITVAFASWRRRSGDLSFSTLLGSSLSNIFLIGILAMANNLQIVQTKAHIITFVTFVVLAIIVSIFYRSGKRLSRLEGGVILLVYVVFVILQMSLV
jgi:cation:H+ antiporter